MGRGAVTVVTAKHVIQSRASVLTSCVKWGGREKRVTKVCLTFLLLQHDNTYIIIMCSYCLKNSYIYRDVCIRLAFCIYVEFLWLVQLYNAMSLLNSGYSV